MRLMKLLIAALLIAAALNAYAFTVYIVQSEQNDSYSEILESFKNRALFDFIIFNMDGNGSLVSEIVGKVKVEKPDAVFLIGALAVKEIAVHLENTPLILAMISQIPSELKDRTNLCGVLYDVDDKLVLDFFKKAFPQITRLCIVFKMENTMTYAKGFKDLADSAGLSVELANVNEIEDFNLAVKMLNASQVQAIWLGKDRLVQEKEGFDELIKISKKESIPIIALSTVFPKKGALASISPDLKDMGYKAGSIAIRLSNGELPADIGFKNPTIFEFGYNKSMASFFGVEAADSVLLNATIY